MGASSSAAQLIKTADGAFQIEPRCALWSIPLSDVPDLIHNIRIFKEATVVGVRDIGKTVGHVPVWKGTADPGLAVGSFASPKKFQCFLLMFRCKGKGNTQHRAARVQRR